MMLNCREATRLLSDAQERRISTKDRVALKFHLMMCSGCRNFAHQMDTLRDISHHYAKDPENTNPPEHKHGDDKKE